MNSFNISNFFLSAMLKVSQMKTVHAPIPQSVAQIAAAISRELTSLLLVWESIAAHATALLLQVPTNHAHAVSLRPKWPLNNSNALQLRKLIANASTKALIPLPITIVATALTSITSMLLLLMLLWTTDLAIVRMPLDLLTQRLTAHAVLPHSNLLLSQFVLLLK